MFDVLNGEIKTAMISKDKFKVETLKLLKSALLKIKIDSGKEINDELFVNILQKEIKNRKELIDLYDKVGQADRSSVAQSEIDILKELLPDQLSEQEVRSRILAVIESHQLEAAQSNFGMLMATIKSELGNTTDNTTISRILKDIINK